MILAVLTSIGTILAHAHKDIGVLSVGGGRLISSCSHGRSSRISNERREGGKGGFEGAPRSALRERHWCRAKYSWIGGKLFQEKRDGSQERSDTGSFGTGPGKLGSYAPDGRISWDRVSRVAAPRKSPINGRLQKSPSTFGAGLCIIIQGPFMLQGGLFILLRDWSFRRALV